MIQHYPRHYASARQAFLDGATGRVASHEMKARGPDGEALHMDMTVLGPADARQVLVITSGVHGLELFAGSRCQTRLLADADRLPADLKVVLVHAANPWGAAHVRRNNELNVDLCRNFYDTDNPPSRNEDYERVHELLLEAGNNGMEGHEAMAALAGIRSELGERRYNEAVMGGQYRHRDGFAFGGFAPSESRKVLEPWLLQQTDGAQQVVMLDLHTGLGDHGAATVVSMQQGAALAQAQAWYGERLVAPANTDAAEFPEVRGHTTPGYERLLIGRSVLSVIVEFGTFAHDRIMKALLADHWSEHSGIHPAHQALIKDELLECFSPVSREWIEAVDGAFDAVLAETLTGMQS